MATERTPEELQDYAADEQLIRDVLDSAIENYASWKYAETADLDPQTCERWVNTIWNRLRCALDSEQRLHAIILLIEPAARQRYEELARGMS